MGGWDVVRDSVSTALRSIRRKPGFAAAVVATLGVGIGVNAMLFGVVDRLLLSPPSGIQNPERLHRVFVEREMAGEIQATRGVSLPDLVALEDVASFSSVAAYGNVGDEVTLSDEEGSIRVRPRAVSGDFFATLGARPHTGRLITPADDDLAAPAVALLSHGFWERRFGADPAVLGRVLDIGSASYEIVGVAEPGFTGVEVSPVDVWLPMKHAGKAEYGPLSLEHASYFWLSIVARRAAGVSVEAATQEATAAHRAGRPEDETPERYDPRARVVLASLIPAESPEPGREAAVARWLAIVSLLVLGIAAANVANLFLARAVRARTELALRAALGAGRGRLLGQLSAEAALLATIAAAAAVTLAGGAGRLIERTLLPNVLIEEAVSPVRLVSFVAALVALTAVLAGLLPALRASRVDPRGDLRESGRGATRATTRASRLLVTAQACLSTVLVIGAGLFVLSLHDATTLDLGFDPARVATLRLELASADADPGSAADAPAPDRWALYDQALERLRRRPDVEVAARYLGVPFGNSFGLPVFVPDIDTVPTLGGEAPSINAVGPDYFEALGIRIAAGRGFLQGDTNDEAEPVAIVNQAFADLVWDGDALGRCVKVAGPGADCRRIIGVAANHREADLVEDAKLMTWIPVGTGSVSGYAGLVMRTSGDPRASASAIQRDVAALSPSIRWVDIETLRERIEPEYRSWKLGATVLSVYGLLALLVAAVGTYGLLAFEVAERRRELGIRTALGANRGALVGSVIRRGVGMTALGVVVGLAVAFATTDILEPLLFGVSPTDSRVLGGTAAALLGIAAAAAYLPARVAAAVDPIVAMRQE